MVISYRPRVRLGLLNRRNFYYRVSDKELEAVQAFNFLDDITISSPDEDESCSKCSEYIFFMDYEQEQGDEQKEAVPSTVTKEDVVRDEYMPNMEENGSLIELVPETVGIDGETISDSSLSDVKILNSTEVVINNGEPHFLGDDLSWAEQYVSNMVDELLESSDIKSPSSKTELMDVNIDSVEDDGFHDKQVNAPPSPPLFVALDHLSLSDSCTESYFGSDSGGSSFIGGK